MADEHAGRFIWHELMTSDPSAAQSFYTKVVGWGTTPFEGLDSPYTIFLSGATPEAGLMQLPDMAKEQGAPPSWITYVAVEDVDRGVERAQKLGGQVHVPPRDIPEVGRFAIVADPQGATFALYRGAGDPPDAPEPATGFFSWHELTTSDADGAWRFYSELFGWKATEAMDLGGGEMYQMFGYGAGDDLSVGGMSRRAGVPPSWLPYVLVAGLDGVVERIGSMGGTVVLGPMEVPGGDRIAVASDPQGAVLGYHGRPA